MSERWATIIKSDEGVEVISVISQMEGVAPEIRDDQKKNTRVQRIADGVKIGMIKGGPVDTVAGWGFPEGTASTAPAPSSKPSNLSNPDEKSRWEEKAPKASQGQQGSVEQDAAQAAQRKAAADQKAAADAKAKSDAQAKAKA